VLDHGGSIADPGRAAGEEPPISVEDAVRSTSRACREDHDRRNAARRIGEESSAMFGSGRSRSAILKNTLDISSRPRARLAARSSWTEYWCVAP
jgi:hypothetical protein